SRTMARALVYVALSALLGGLLLTACSQQAPITLEGQEVREYQGEDLSSVNDLHDNSIKGPQVVDKDSYRLAVSGLVDKPQSLTYDQAINRQQYTKVVTLHCVEGWYATILWEGVLVEDLLNQAGIKDGANTVIFHAADGYTSSLSLDFIRQNKILLAYKMNEVTLPAERGFPFQVVAEAKWGYKWVKWVTEIELSDDPSYQGYWEGRGYNNNGVFDGPMFQ
ncbi:MAG: molybdopterin-dependent oxidoreductase, partial [Chloroflexota bacterium]